MAVDGAALPLANAEGAARTPNQLIKSNWRRCLLREMASITPIYWGEGVYIV